MKLDQIGVILEGISPIIYHVTNIPSLVSILETDKFRLTPDIASSAETEHRADKNKVYFLSTTRHKLGGFGLTMGSRAVTLMLDGKKLGQRYSGGAVDYWGADFRKLDPVKSEAEDRIFNSKRYIDNATSYIKEVHIYMDLGKPEERPIVIQKTRQLLIELKKQKLDYWVYDDKQAYILQQKTKKVKIPKEFLTVKNKDDLRKSPYYRHNRKNVSRWIELYYKKSESELSKRAKDLIGYLYSDFYKNDMLNGLSADMHNDKNNPESGVDTIINIIQKEKVQDLKGFTDMIADKWTQSDEQLTR